jgi:hypothetical protein
MENELAQRVPRRGPVVRLTEAGAPLPRRNGLSSPPTSSASGRCLPESRPKAERFTPVSRRSADHGSVEGSEGTAEHVAERRSCSAQRLKADHCDT